MKKPSFFYILVVSILLLAIADIVLSLRLEFLESNIGLIWLYSKVGAGWAWIFIIGFKLLLIFGLIWVLSRQEYKTERYMFFVMTLFAFMLVAQAYGVYTGIKVTGQVQGIEEQQGESISLEAKDMIRIQVKEGAVKTYPTKTFWIAIFPLIIANLSFYIFEKMYPSAKVEKPRWR